MSEIAAIYAALKARDKRERSANRTLTAQQFSDAARIAIQCGMSLRRCDDAQYQLRHDGRILNIYPGNRRLYADRNKPFPFIDVPYEWDLLDVLQAAIAKIYDIQRDSPE